MTVSLVMCSFAVCLPSPHFTVTEQLPVELREQFTEMREMDLQVQSKIFIVI